MQTELWIAEELAYKKRQHIKCPQTRGGMKTRMKMKMLNERENVHSKNVHDTRWAWQCGRGQSRSCN